MAKSSEKQQRNYRILQFSANLKDLSEYFDPESRLNVRVLEKSESGDDWIFLVGLLPENNRGSIYIGYDVMICRNNKIPKSEDWGTWGWSWNKLEQAKKQFDDILSRSK